MAKNPAAFARRQREMERQQKKQAKRAERRERRERQKESPSTTSDPLQDPTIDWEQSVGEVQVDDSEVEI
jgi:hypothetical protein